MSVSVPDRLADEVARPRRRRWPWLVALALILLATAAGVGWRWLHSPAAFREAEQGYIVAVEREADDPVWTVLAISETSSPVHGDVEILDLDPVVERDGARVSVEYVICELDAEVLEKQGVGAFGFGLHQDSVDELCLRTRPAAGGTFHDGGQTREDLLVRLTPTHPGRSTVTAHRIRWREGWQRGEDLVEVEVRVHVPRP